MKRIQNISISLTSLLSECGGHQGTPRTLLLALFLLLALTSCQKRPQPTTPDDQKTLIGFSPVSQSAAVKSTTSLSTIHDDFGVWGIARQEGNNTPYVLWDNNRLSQVKQSSPDAETYVPVGNAYWLSGYKYNFIAIAPYNDPALTLTTITSSTPYSISFSYDMGKKYESDYVFDLLGAAAATETISGGRTESQNLTFWHLFTKLCVKVRFNNVTTGNVTGMRLVNVNTQAAYTFSLNTGTTLNVSHSNPSQNSTTITFDAEHFEEVIDEDGTWEVATVHILPQDISDFELYLDFIIDDVQINNFKINIDKVKTAPQYGDNEQYNWKVVISPKGIAFDVEINDWIYYEDDPDHNIEFPIE